LGFKRAIVPRGQVYPEDVGLEIVPVGKVIEAIVAAIPPQQRFGEDMEEEEGEGQE
jgi:DNA repair protein RadA/Sms